MSRYIKHTKSDQLKLGNIVKGEYVSRAEITIERSAADIWPYLLMHQADWMPAICIETIAGDQNQIGELKRVTLRDLGDEAEPFFFKTLKIFPEKQFFYKAFTKNPWRNGVYNGYSFDGYEMITLVECNGLTSVIFNALLRMESSRMTAVEMRAWIDAGSKVGDKMWEQNLLGLKRLVMSKES